MDEASVKCAPTTDYRLPTTHITNHHPPCGHLLPKEGKRTLTTDYRLLTSPTIIRPTGTFFPKKASAS